MRDLRRWSYVGLLALSTGAGCESEPGAEAEGGESSSADGDTAGEEGGEEGGEDGEVDGEAVVAEALGYAAFARVNAESMASQHGLADTVNVWVPQVHEGAYRAIDPGDAAASVDPFPPGTLIVKEHLDAGAAAAGLTLMFKGPAGYDPEHGDWWWGNATLEGSLVDEGAVDYCIACHTPRADADWLFGIAAEDQS